VRISCTECHTFVELPEPIGLLGKFVCVECRRARNRADATPIPQRPSTHDPPAALAARRAARASQPEIDMAAPQSGPPDVSELVARVAPPQAAPSNPFALSFTPRQDIATHPTFDKSSTPAPAPNALPRPQPTQPTPLPNAAAFDQRPAQPYFAPPAPPRPAPPRSAPPPPFIATPAFDAPARPGASSTVKLVLLGVIAVGIVAGAAVLWRAGSPAPVAPAAVTAPAAVPAAPTTAAAAAQPASGGERPASDEFDRVAANEQLNKLAEEAGSCRKPDDPAGVARVQVTFEPSGAVKESTVEKGSASGKAVGKCLAKLFEDARVPPFKGEPVTITKSVVLR
jgi:hypothetical protein